MKKALATGLLAICLIAISQQQASAWHNSRFGIGMNWDYSSGGNSFGWGLWRSGQPPGPEGFGGGDYGNGHGRFHGMAPQGFAPSAQGYAPMQQGTFDLPIYEPAYAQPYAPPYAPPFQFATYPRPVYYYYGR